MRPRKYPPAPNGSARAALLAKVRGMYDSGMGITELCDIIGYSHTTTTMLVDECGATRRSRKEEMALTRKYQRILESGRRHCPSCGKPLLPEEENLCRGCNPDTPTELEEERAALYELESTSAWLGRNFPRTVERNGKIWHTC